MSNSELPPKKRRSPIGEKTYQTRQRNRRLAHVGGQKNADSVIRLAAGIELYFCVAGQFSFINVLDAILKQMNEPADLAISSWTVAEFEMSRLAHYLETGLAARVRFITDRSFITRHPDIYAALVDLLGIDSIRVLRCHAKFAIATSDSWSLAIRTSANLNSNRRIENYEISDDPGLARYMGEIVEEIFSHPADRTIGRAEMTRMKTVGEGGIAPKKISGAGPGGLAADPTIAALDKMLGIANE